MSRVERPIVGIGGVHWFMAHWASLEQSRIQECCSKPITYGLQCYGFGGGMECYLENKTKQASGANYQNGYKLHLDCSI